MKILRLIVLAFGVKIFHNKIFSITNIGFDQIFPSEKKSSKYKARLKSYLSLNVFVNPLVTDSTDWVVTEPGNQGLLRELHLSGITREISGNFPKILPNSEKF